MRRFLRKIFVTLPCRLVKAGHKVGVVRQTEVAVLKAMSDSRDKMLKRDLDALYTPATLVGSGSIASYA